MSQRHIIYVPGKGPKPLSKQHREMLWRSMLEGVRRVDPDVFHDLNGHVDSFKLIAWNYLYYQTRKTNNNEAQWVKALIQKQKPTERDIRQAKAWKHKLDKALYKAIDQLPTLVQVLPRSAKLTAEELDRYFNNKEKVASQVREQLKQELRPLLENGDKVLLIGHSLGSVISYDTLWALSQLEHLPGKIDLFLTIGSPLGMNYVQKRLLGNKYKDHHKKYPSNIRNWVNISAVGDITPLDRNLADDYKGMLKPDNTQSITDYSKDIYNYFQNEEGLNFHRSYGYLVNPAVGNVIADWWIAHS
jgi:pimeloyl-ACP methyl ester carboxylesterase